ncbi:hypothetical protein KP509_23G007900 [Ceratopteris richardii]|nr:hypothetical protein KP509_23G007900 [Ceratopteris richardii]
MPAIFLVERRHCINALLFFMDQALAFLLLGAAASSTEASYIAKRGESKTQWSEVCSTIEHFCTRVGVSLFLTFTAVLVFIALGIMSAKRLFGSSATCAPSCQLSAHA